MEKPKSKQPANEPKLIYMDHLRVEHDLKRDCQCAAPAFVIDRSNNRVRCTKCRAILEPITVLIMMADQRERLNQTAKAQHEEYKKMVAMEQIYSEKVAAKKRELATLDKEVAAAKKRLSTT